MTRPEPPVRIGILGAARLARQFGEGPQQWTGATEQQSIDIAAMLAAINKSARAGAPVAV
jgi:hypothetical protein